MTELWIAWSLGLAIGVTAMLPRSYRQRDALLEAERHMAWYANETHGAASYPGCARECLRLIRRALNVGD